MSDRKYRKEEMTSLRSLKSEELVGQDKELSEQAFWLNWKHKSGQVENTASIRDARRKVARIRTLLTEKEKVENGKEKRS